LLTSIRPNENALVVKRPAQLPQRQLAFLNFGTMEEWPLGRTLKLHPKAHVLVTTFGREGRTVRHAFGKIDTIAGAKDLFAIILAAAGIIADLIEVMFMARIETLRRIDRHARIETNSMGPVEKPEILAFASTAAVADNLTKNDILSRNNDRTGYSHKELLLRIYYRYLGLLSPSAARVVKHHNELVSKVRHLGRCQGSRMALCIIVASGEMHIKQRLKVFMNASR
jgi:hypothetical protein